VLVNSLMCIRLVRRKRKRAPYAFASKPGCMALQSVELFRRQFPVEAPWCAPVHSLLGSHQTMQELELPWGFSHVEVQKPLRRPRSCSARLGALFVALRRTASRPSCRRTSPARSGTSSQARRPSARAARGCSALLRVKHPRHDRPAG
jgi:hypothetical protein